MAKLKLPCVIAVSDYHEFSYIEDILNEISSAKIMIKELDPNPPLYIGLIYSGRCPSNKTIKKLLERDIK